MGECWIQHSCHKIIYLSLRKKRWISILPCICGAFAINYWCFFCCLRFYLYFSQIIYSFVYLILCALYSRAHTHFRCNHINRSHTLTPFFSSHFIYFHSLYSLTHSFTFTLFIAVPFHFRINLCELVFFLWHWQTDMLDICSFISIMVFWWRMVLCAGGFLLTFYCMLPKRGNECVA